MTGDESLTIADDLLDVSVNLLRAARIGAGDGLGGELSLAQMRLLRLVGRQPHLTVTEVAEQLRLAPNTVSTIVGRLTGLGLLARNPDPHDGRVSRLHLAPEAEARMTAWRAIRLQVTAAAASRLAPDEIAAVRAAIPALRQLSELMNRVEAKPAA